MSKFVAGLAAAIMMVAGLATGGAATAATAYPATVKTKTGVSAATKVKRKKPVKARVRVQAAGSAKPKGTVTATLYRLNKAGHWVKLRVKIQKYTGSIKGFSFGPRKAGKYKIVVKFTPKPGSVFKKSKDTVKVRVG